MNQSTFIEPTGYRAAEEFLSGLILFREELGDIGTQLIDILVSAGVKPEQGFTVNQQQNYLH